MTVMGPRAITLLLGVGLLWAEPGQEYTSALQKIEAIAEEEVPRGSTVHFSPAEVNAFARGEAAAAAEDGLKDVSIQLGAGEITSSAVVNLAKLPHLEGLSASWLLGNLLEGDTPITIRARVTSGGGTATVHIESVTIGQRELDEGTTDFLVGWILQPFLGKTKLGEPMELGHNVESILIRPSGIEVRIGD